MKLLWSPKAIEDLVESNIFIARENPEAARNIISEVYEARISIKEFPEKGRIVPEVGKADIREIFCRGYRIIYQIETKKISILRIRHMRQKPLESEEI